MAHEKAVQKWPSILDDAKRLAACAVGHILIAAAKTTPSGKQNSFASHCEPSGILVEIKQTKTPTSYANAFAAPAHIVGEGSPEDDGPDRVSLVGRSIAQLGDHVYWVRKALGTQAKLLWHGLPLWRYPLEGWKREKDGRKAKDEKGKELGPIELTEKTFESLGGEPGKPPGLVDAVIESLGLGLAWSQVMDAGKTPPGGPQHA